MEEEWKITSEAIYNAKKAFYKTIEEAGYDGAYWNLRIEADMLSSDFRSILERFIYDNEEESLNVE